MAILQRHYDAVGLASNETQLLSALLEFAAELDFGLVSAALVRGTFDSPGLWGKSVGNPPAAYAEISKDPEVALGDPVLARLMKSPVPLAYDQSFYVEAGRAPFWELMAEHGYKTGIAMGLRLGGQHFMLGVDRERPLPKNEVQLMRLLADLQLLGVHAQSAMSRLFGPPAAANEPPPRLTPREIEVLKWSADGKSAWVVGNLLGITERGVHAHIQNSMRKLGVGSKTGAVLKAVQCGLLSK